MSSKYIVRQQIKDANGAVVAYEILYHGENQAFGGMSDGNVSNEFAAADTIYNFLTQNTPKVLKGSLTFMTFTTMLLMKKTPRLFDKSELVIQIDDSVIIHPLSMHFVQQYANEGYKIAVNEFQFSPRYLALMDSIDYIKVNIKNTNEVNIKNIIEIAHSMDKKCIITHIETAETYEKAVSMGADAFEGTYVAEVMTQKAHSSSYLQSNFFRLMVSVTKGIEPETGLRMSQIVEQITQRPVVVLTGPSHAEEVAASIPTGCLAAHVDKALAELVQDAFMSDAFRIYTSPDALGAELGGALKNVIAMCAGVTDGLGYGDNIKAMLMTRGLTEVARLGVSLGASKDTFAGLEGVWCRLFPIRTPNS